MSAVVHIITALERGGAQRNTLETVARLHRPDRPQWLITGCYGDASLFEEALQRLGERLITIPALDRPIQPKKDLRAILAIYRCLLHLRQSLGVPLIVHTHSSKAGILGRLAARAIPGCQAIHTVHGFGFEAVNERSKWILKAAESLAGKVTKALIFVSEADIQLARQLQLAPQAAFYTIRSGIDLANFAASNNNEAMRIEARRQWQIPEHVPLIVTVANCKPQKDPLFHVDIFAAFLQLEPDAWLLFVGDGILKPALVQRAVELGVSQRILLPGFVCDPRPAYAAGDVFLLASRWEGLPRSVLEAIASGLPGVVRDAGWAKDLAWAENFWSLSPEAPPGEFAEALRDALATKRLPTWYNKKPYHLPEAFTLNGMLAQLDELYEKLLSE